MSLKSTRGMTRGEVTLRVSVLLSLYRGAFVVVVGDEAAFVVKSLIGVVVKVVVSATWLLLQLERFFALYDLAEGERCL